MLMMMEGLFRPEFLILHLHPLNVENKQKKNHEFTLNLTRTSNTIIS